MSLERILGVPLVMLQAAGRLGEDNNLSLSLDTDLYLYGGLVRGSMGETVRAITHYYYIG